MLYFREGKFAEAEQHLRDGVAVLRGQPPSATSYLVQTMSYLAQALLVQKQLTQEVEMLLTEAESLLPKLRPLARRDVGHALVLARCSYLLQKHADHAAVAKRLKEYRKNMLSEARRLQEVAYTFVQCLPVVERDAKLEAGAKQQLQADYGAEAVALLRQAWQRGVVNPGRWETDPVLQPLRSREDFQQLLAQVRTK
jgi:hypothetical protein